VPLLRAHGALRRLGGIAFLAWDPAPWRFILRTPFSDWPNLEARASSVADYQRAQAAQQALQARPVRPYGLDAWKGKGKVLSVEWDDQELSVISFRPGPWEAELLALGR
jgi:hypothetical protein